MSRTTAREMAFRLLFQVDIGHNPWEVAFEQVKQEGLLSDEDAGFFEDLVRGTIKNIAVIDKTITHYAKDWTIERMASTDRNILRLAVYEIRDLDNPVAVTINEAVEMAKLYGDENSGKFVNGILGQFARETKLVTATESKAEK